MTSDLHLYVVQATDTVRTAMERIEANKHRAVVVVDQGKVVGVVSDGDIRRAFLHDVLPVAPVTRIMQINPHVTSEPDPARRAELLRTLQITLLPYVSSENELLGVQLAYEPGFLA